MAYMKLLIFHASILFEVIWPRDELKRGRQFFFAATVGASM